MPLMSPLPRDSTPTETAALLAAARRLGWSDAEIIEALAMACHAGWTNTFAQGLRLEDDLSAPEFAAYFLPALGC
jgi:hypothetical protein